MSKQLTFGVIVGNRGFFPDHLAKEGREEVLGVLEKAGIRTITLTPEQDAAMRKAMDPVYKDVATRVGQPLIDEFVKETGGVSH